MSAVGNAIRELRVKKGLSLREVAGKQMTVANLSSIELGKVLPSPNSLEYLARALGTTLERLVTEYLKDVRRVTDLLNLASVARRENQMEVLARVLSIIQSRALTDNLSKLNYARLLGHRAYLQYHRGKYKTSLKLYDAAAQEAVRAASWYEAAAASYSSGALLMKEGNFLSAACKLIDSLGYAVSCEQGTEREKLVIKILQNLGIASLSLGLTEQARKCFKAVAIKSKRIGDSVHETRALMGCGLTYELENRWGDFRYWHERALETACRAELDHGIRSDIMSNIGMGFSRQGMYEEALSLFDASLALRTPGDPHYICTISEKTLCLLKAGRLQEAVALADQYIHALLDAPLNDPCEQAVSIATLACVRARQGAERTANQLTEELEEYLAGLQPPQRYEPATKATHVFLEAGLSGEAVRLLLFLTRNYQLELVKIRIPDSYLASPFDQD